MYQAHRILNHLYQGGLPPGGSVLSEKGVDVIVLAAAQFQDASAYQGVQVILAPGDDDHRLHRLALFIDAWKDAARQVVDHIRAGKRVLVTCIAGQNRSGLITALAVRELTGWSGKQIVQHIQANRPMALNNPTFVKYIYESFPNPR